MGLQLLPWGDKLTSESIQFFSPIVLWTRPASREDFQGTVFSAFKDYLAVSSLLNIFTLLDFELETIGTRNSKIKYQEDQVSSAQRRVLVVDCYTASLISVGNFHS